MIFDLNSNTIRPIFIKSYRPKGLDPSCVVNSKDVIVESRNLYKQECFTLFRKVLSFFKNCPLSGWKGFLKTRPTNSCLSNIPLKNG